MKTRAEARVVWIRKSGELAVALLVLFAAATRARIVAAHTHALRQRQVLRLRIHRGFDLARFGRRGIGHVGNAFATVFHLLCGLVQLLLRLHLHSHENLGDFVLDLVDQLAEQLEGLALVFLLGLLLRIATQVTALAQIVQCGEVVAPIGVEASIQQKRLRKTV